VHIKVCPVLPSEFRRRLSLRVAARRPVPVVRDARLVPHHSQDATDIFREVRYRVEEDRRDALNRRDELVPVPQRVDNFAALQDEAARHSAAPPDALDIFVLAAERLQVLQLPPTRPQVQAAQVEMQDCLERAAQVAAERRVSEPMARRVSQEHHRDQPQELCPVSQPQEHARVRSQERKKLEDVRPSQAHQPRPEPHQALQRDAPAAPPESFPEPLASPPLLQELLALPSQVSQARPEQAQQPPGARQDASRPWPSPASRLPPPLPSQPDLENVSAQVQPCPDRANSSASSFP
jgi:hypothetical protein